MAISSSAAGSYVAPSLAAAAAVSSVTGGGGGGGGAATAASLAHSLMVKASQSHGGIVGVGSGGDDAATVTSTTSSTVAPSLGKRQAGRRRCWNIFSTSMVLACMIVAGIAMVLEQTVLVYIAFCIPLLVTAPLALAQKWQLRGLSPMWLLRTVIHEGRKESVRLHDLGSLFGSEVTRLQGEEDALRDVERQVAAKVKERGGDMRELMKLVREHGQIQKEMKRLVAAEELQQLFSVMLHSDSDCDLHYSEKELDRLIIRLQAFSVVDKDRLRKVFAGSSSKSFAHLYNAVADEHLSATADEEDPFDDNAFNYVMCYA